MIFAIIFRNKFYIMKKVFWFFVLNIISFIASFSAMGTGNNFGYIISLGCWGIIIAYILVPNKRKEAR